MVDSKVKDALTPYTRALYADDGSFTPDILVTALRKIFVGEASDIQTATFLGALRMRGLDQQSQFIAAAVTTVLEFLDTIDPALVLPEGYIDIVGTGGDGQNTFNVSTSSAIVAAGMGLKVCKHGGKASTSASGLGDLLKCLGVETMNVNSLTTPLIVTKSDFCFLFAPAFHPGMAKVAHIRADMGVPTIFNILGPLINPIPIRARILGVYSKQLGEAYAEAASLLAKKLHVHRSTMVVYGDVGLDEISPVGTTLIWRVDEHGNIARGTISPRDFDLPEHPLLLVKSGTPEENAKILLYILKQDFPEFVIKPENNHPLVDYILLNSAALAVVSGIAASWKEGVQVAKNAIISGAAWRELQAFTIAVEKAVPA